MNTSPMASRHARAQGFSLVMLMVLVAACGIALGVAVLLGARQLDAQRTAETRHMLPQAFRAVFPHPQGSPGADMWRDFAYRPDPPTAFLRGGDKTRAWDLSGLVDRTRVGQSDGTFGTPPPLFDGTNAGTAWNGPYWRGPLDGDGRPVDAWGRLLELRWVASPSSGWILHSPGANGVDDTAPDAGAPGGDDLVFPSPPYLPPTSTYTTFTATLDLTFALRNPSTCGTHGNNVFLRVVASYQDATSNQTLEVLPTTQLHRNGSGKPNRVENLTFTLAIRSTPVGSGGLFTIAVTGGCPDEYLNAADFLPTSNSLLTYLGSSTSGETTTYAFSVSYVPPPATATPWPITISP